MVHNVLILMNALREKQFAGHSKHAKINQADTLAFVQLDSLRLAETVVRILMSVNTTGIDDRVLRMRSVLIGNFLIGSKNGSNLNPIQN